MEIWIFLLALLVGAPLLGEWCALVLWRPPNPQNRAERVLFRGMGIGDATGMDSRTYLKCILWFSALSVLVLWVFQVLQHHLPLNPRGLAGVEPVLALNTAISFMTNTNWQAYSGEALLGHFVQMAGLGVQNFVSAGAGIAVVLAFARGMVQKEGSDLGNFWSDLVRSCFYILLPLSLICAVLLVSQGVVQNFSGITDVKTLEGVLQSIPGGPAASQIAIKQLGSNGGGFFGVNSAHPFENSTPFSNFLQTYAILLLPAAVTWVFGRVAGSRKHGVAIFASMLLLFLGALAVTLWAERAGNPVLGGLPFMEGKEVRFGIDASALWASATTAASNGSVNAMHDSLSPLGGLMAIWNMMTGEVVFGGVGAGTYGMLNYVIVAVFIAGLMVGRTPEYLGKKIEAREITLAILAILIPSAVVLIMSAIASSTTAGISSLTNKGPHGLSEIIYAFASTAGNNGSSFGGLNANTPFYNLMTSAAMLIGRFGVIVPFLMIAGSMARKKIAPPSVGTFPTDGAMFVGLLVGVVVIVGALTFLPALALGPILDHLMMLRGMKL